MEFEDTMQPIIELAYSQMQMEQENEVMRAVQKIGVNVDKDRLIQALTDARKFWDEGYEAGRREQPRWISVEERLPEQRDAYLAATKDGDVYDAEFFPGVKQWWIDDDLRLDVTHWMPLPEAPEVEV